MSTEMEPTLIIHHLSDIHVGPLHYEAAHNKPFVPQSSDPRNLLLYMNHLRNCQIEDLPDLLIISGDLTSSASEKEIYQVKDKIEEIKELLMRKNPAWRKNKALPYILMVPGNHDLDWSKDSYKEKIDRYARMSDSLYDNGKVLSAAYHAKKNPVSFDFGDECNLFVYLFNTTSLGGIKDPKFEGIYKSISDRYGQILHDKESDENLRRALKALEAETRKDPGYIRQEDLEEMSKELKNVPQRRFKIAVMHHNLSSIPSDDIESFDTIINAGPVKKSLMKNGFDLVFHGHRHFMHGCHERFLGPSSSLTQGIFILGGDTIGEDEEAPFLEVRLYGTDKAHGKKLPACLFTVSLATYQGATYSRRFQPFIEEIIDSPINAAVGEVLRRLGRNIPLPERQEDKRHLRESIDMIQLPLQELQSQLVGWGEESDDWIRRFNFQLGEYYRIYATDVYPRSSVGSPRFNKYLRRQYASRLEKLKSRSDHCLRFSQPVYDAIVRTGWRPDPIMWGDYQIEKTTRSSLEDLEIVRILVRPKATLQDRQELENLDFDHRVFAIPLFILDRQQLLKSNQLIDFAIGFNEVGNVSKCYEFIETEGLVGEVTLWRGGALKNIFEKMLSDNSLKTVGQFIRHGVMITDRKDARIFARNYDNTRRASTAILKVLRQNLHPSPNKRGLDIGCGTGNYTIPFINDFAEVIGLDISREMLNEARRKSDKVNWREADGLETGLPGGHCDAVWLISALHYFIGEGQNLLFKEIYRVLGPGGVVVADTEFKEQHESLWLVEFFPSLKERYKNAILSTRQYENWLHDIGFSDVRFEQLTLEPTDNDASLRIGQHNPERYFESEILEGIPAFREMQASERERGLGKLRNAIDTGAINEIIAGYERKATMKGDVGIIIASRPL